MSILYTKIFLLIVLLICLLSPGNNSLHKYVEIKARITNLSIHSQLRLLTEKIPANSLSGLKINDKDAEHDHNEEHEGNDDENVEEKVKDKGQNKHYKNDKYHKNNKKHEKNKMDKYDEVNINHQSKSKTSKHTDQDGVNYKTIPKKSPALRNGVKKENIDNNNSSISATTSNNINSKIKNSDEQRTPLDRQYLIEKSLYELKVCKNIYDAQKKYADQIIDSMDLTEEVKNKFKEFAYYYIWQKDPSHQRTLYNKIKKDIEKYTKNHVICTIIDFENLYYFLNNLK
ncbi:Plasmodium exported protein, unknown function [Plasmodium sp. gorilla clade G3]|nr:Plasmodium exported protein, unknown function [Plasmodium sp. gorilla clade G3]